MKHKPEREQILEALRKHGKIYLAANEFGVSAFTLQNWMKQYGICVGHVMKMNNPEAEVLIMPGRQSGQSAIAAWFKKKFKKEN